MKFGNDRKKVNLGSLKNDFIKSIKIYNAALAEFERIESYSEKGHLASAQEVIEYQKWKESLLNEH